MLLCISLPTVIMFGLTIGLWQVLAVVTFPISMLKQAISVIQMIEACKHISALDVVSRSRLINSVKTDIHTIGLTLCHDIT